MSASEQGAVIAGVRVSSPDRVLFEELGLTKAALACYYESIAEWILPDLRGRPLSLVRCPQGPGEGCFYQKHIDAAWSEEIERVAVPESDGEGIYAVAGTAGALVGLVQKGVIELHVWGSTTRDLGKPDRMVFDLDPDPDVRWREVMAAARLTRERLEAIGLVSFAKTSGQGCMSWCRSRRAMAGRGEGVLARGGGRWRDDPQRFTAKMASAAPGGSSSTPAQRRGCHGRGLLGARAAALPSRRRCIGTRSAGA
jgi:bifunctional non-homologous end joining protein LigD